MAVFSCIYRGHRSGISSRERMLFIILCDCLEAVSGANRLSGDTSEYLYRMTNPKIEDLVDEMRSILSEKGAIRYKEVRFHFSTIISAIASAVS